MSHRTQSFSFTRLAVAGASVTLLLAAASCGGKLSEDADWCSKNGYDRAGFDKCAPLCTVSKEGSQDREVICGALFSFPSNCASAARSGGSEWDKIAGDCRAVCSKLATMPTDLPQVLNGQGNCDAIKGK